MPPREWSSIDRIYLIGLEAPQSIAEEVRRLRESARKNGMVAAPLPAMLPLILSSHLPRTPVPGLLPPCEEALEPAEDLVRSVDGTWLIWPVGAGDWPDLLAAALGSWTDETESIQPQWPLIEGIPIAEVQDSIADPAIIPGKRPGWRKLQLSCWRIEYLSGRPWHRSCLWRPMWNRRLKRAPSLSNNDNDNDLA